LTSSNSTSATTSPETFTSLSQKKFEKKDDPCWTSSGEGCKTYNVPLPPLPAPEGRIGYYTPEGEWIVPKKNESNSSNSSASAKLL
jgi:hypothetical protein